MEVEVIKKAIEKERKLIGKNLCFYAKLKLLYDKKTEGFDSMSPADIIQLRKDLEDEIHRANVALIDEINKILG